MDVPFAGIMRGGEIRELPAWRKRINRGQGVPTPASSDYKIVSKKGQRRGQLSEFVHLWPTPSAQMAAQGPGRQGRDGGPNLVTAVAERGPWATPNARDWKAAPGAGSRGRGGRGRSLPADVQKLEGSGNLNPTWVEWLMGFEMGYTKI